MAAKASNLAGQSFGELIALRPTNQRSHNKTIIWECECQACKAITAVPSTKLVSNEVRSCGCLEHVRETRTPPGHVGANMKYQSYFHGAKSRNLSFELSFSQFKHLCLQSCVYCGLPPEKGTTITARGSSARARKNGAFTSNGIDRKDSALGYSLDNCVPCCTQCNRAKLDMSTEEFYIWIRRLVENFTVA